MAKIRLYDSTTCRLCAENNDNGEMLFTDDSEETELSAMVNRYLPLKVRKRESDASNVSQKSRLQLDFLVLCNMEARLISIVYNTINTSVPTAWIKSFLTFLAPVIRPGISAHPTVNKCQSLPLNEISLHLDEPLFRLCLIYYIIKD